jgi:ABC-2 type transport system ATP-binding protein
MWELFRDVNAAGTTIILTTHYLEEAESLCRNIAIIDDGRIIEHDAMSNVIRKLQVEVFVLNLGTALREAPELPGFVTRLRSATELEVEIAKGQTLNTVFDALTARRIDVESMRTKTNRLEELFMRLVEDKKQDAAA